MVAADPPAFILIQSTANGPMTALCFTDAPQIDELPECWTDEAIDLYLEDARWENDILIPA
jgi:hypothetical protein